MIVPINSATRPKVNQMVAQEWAGPMIVTRGRLHDTSNADGFVSVHNEEITGYILYTIEDHACEILALQSMVENHGIASALITAAMHSAKSHHCTRIWLITTNDNMHAIRYYQKFGFALEAVYINALDASRKIKPSIPLLGKEGIPLKHEFAFGYAL